jgi:hypothetical protein
MKRSETAHIASTGSGLGWKPILSGVRALLPCLLLVQSLAAQVSEAPTTVAPGQWLLEADVVAVAFDRHTVRQDSSHYRSTTVGSTLLSTGLGRKLDVQFGLELWREERTTGAGLEQSDRGCGDGWLRAKWN